MVQTGWVKIYRSTFEKGWARKPEYIALWIWLIQLATHQEREYFWNGNTIILKSGQFITGRKFLSEKTGINESKVERILKCFESEQQIEQRKTSTSRLISILNYQKYQDIEQPFEQRVNNERTTSEQRVNTKQELNNERTKELKKKREKQVFQAPTIFDVESFFIEKGWPVELAKRAFDYYQVANWKDSKGNQVRNWKQKMLSVWMTEKNKTQENGDKPKLTRAQQQIQAGRENYERIIREAAARSTAGNSNFTVPNQDKTT